ncbi:porin [Uliginosibacterium sp. sgz301328]|uniref:porin n=1 Tax=Uliginosibacterium sp. sgz301328 TaxID=3243764 RepID=UPI00359ED6E8
MQKKLIAAAIGALCAVPAFAQSNVTIYGRVDMGYRTFTNDGKATLEDQESSNRWGIQGEENLGGGLKAFFQLENRFYLDNGMQDSARQWKDKAWVGLKHNNLGAVSFGRVASAAYSLYGGTYEAFGGDTIGSMTDRRGKITNNWDNAAKYESPVFGGVFRAIGTLGLSENKASTPDNRWGVGGQLTLGAFKMDGVYQKDTVDDDYKAKMWKTWFLTAAYDFKPVQVFGGYTRSKSYKSHGVGSDDNTYTVYQGGVRVPFGPHTVMGNLGRIEDKVNNDKTKYTHVGLGYWYSLSKRTTLMANVSYDKVNKDGAKVKGPSGAIDDSFGTELAIRHTF